MSAKNKVIKPIIGDAEYIVFEFQEGVSPLTTGKKEDKILCKLDVGTKISIDGNVYIIEGVQLCGGVYIFHVSENGPYSVMVQL